MIGKGPGDVKGELVNVCPHSNCLIFWSKHCGLACFHHTGFPPIFFRPSVDPGERTSRLDTNCHMIVHRFTNGFANPAPDAGLGRNHESQRGEVHREGVRRAFRHASVTALPRRAQPVRDLRNTHADVVDAIDRHQRLRRARRDAGKILAQEARRSIGKDDRCAVLRMRDDGARQAGLNAIGAFRAALQKRCFLRRAGRT